MRKIKRFIRKFLAEWHLRHRRLAVLKYIQRALNLQKIPRAVLAGGMGHDSNYILQIDGKNMGILRLLNPYKKRIVPSDDLPFTILPPEQRIQHEYDMLEKLSAQGLSPAPLLMGDDFLVVEYLPYQPMEKILFKNLDQSWDILARACTRIHELHLTGVIHSDISLANMLISEDGSHIVFVDFEYVMRDRHSVAEGRVYDHLRLLESVWKYLPNDQGYDVWQQSLAQVMDDDMKQVDLDVLRPALSRVLKDPKITANLFA